MNSFLDDGRGGVECNSENVQLFFNGFNAAHGMSSSYLNRKRISLYTPEKCDDVIFVCD